MKRESKADKVLKAFSYLFVGLFCLSIIYPFWNLLVITFNESADTMKGGLGLLPRRFTLENYKNVFLYDKLFASFRMSVYRTVITTVTSILFTSIFAYGISRPGLKFSSLYTKFCVITMYFGAGMIPVYILMKELHLINSFWVYVIPFLFNVWNMIIFRSFFENLPSGLLDAARIDGAGEYRTFFSIVMPVSTPVFATLTLFIAVGQWNSWLDTVIYTTDPKLMTLSSLLRQIISSNNALTQLKMQIIGLDGMEQQDSIISTRSLSATAMMISIIPIAMVYPFLQKHFAGGIMIGAIKG